MMYDHNMLHSVAVNLLVGRVRLSTHSGHLHISQLSFKISNRLAQRVKLKPLRDAAVFSCAEEAVSEAIIAATTLDSSSFTFDLKSLRHANPAVAEEETHRDTGWLTL
jgi:hypothetical protein